MGCINIAVLGVSELKGNRRGYCRSYTNKVFYSANIQQDVAQAVRGYNAKSDQIISIKQCANPVIQVCVPTTDAEDDETESFCVSMEEIDHTTKQNMIIIIGE